MRYHFLGFWVLFFFICFFQSPEYTHGNDIQARAEEVKVLEHYLKTADVVSYSVNYEGRTGAWEVFLDDGKVKHRGFFKHVNRSRPRALPDSYQYEIAAYKLAKLLGIINIPPLVEREIQGVNGSLQIFIENCRRLSDIRRKQMDFPDPNALKNILDGLALFEVLAGDQCRDEDDILVQSDTWFVYRIDFSEAFDPLKEFDDDCRITRCPKDLFHKLEKLEGKKIQKDLSPYINETEMAALLQRKNTIVNNIKDLIEKHGEEAVLY
ncbi:MAG: hypothetical protein JXB26_19910 [Candidatus Aminicenantes bacterium]|nr:hypothetical protein [Candidatus Aminicenantes bacterium]